MIPRYGPSNVSMTKVVIILVGCVCGIALVIGLGLMIAHSENNSPPAGYLSTTPKEVVFLEFTTSHGSLSGSAHVVRLSSSGSRATAAVGSISGTISNNAVTIEDGSAVLTPSGSNISGAIQGSNLVLSFPEQNGQLKPVRFIHATMLNYNATVAKLQHEANQAAAAQAAVQNADAAQAQEQQAITDAAQSVLGDEGSISGGITSMAGAEQSLGAYVSAVEDGLQVVKGELVTEQRDANSDPSVACSDVGLAMASEGSLGADVGDYQDALSSDQSVANGVQEDIVSLQADWTSLTEAEEVDPTHTPSGGLPNSSDKTPVISAASSALTKYQQEVAIDTETINSYLTQAKGYVTQANQLCNSIGG